MLPNIIEHFGILKDPRRDHPNKLHKLIDIVVIVIWGTLANLESWEEIADYADFKQELLKQYLELPNGIPTADTLIRTFALLDPILFATTFRIWMENATPESREVIRHLQLDGKWLLASKSTGTGKSQALQAALQVVTIWASEERLVLAQQAVTQGSNEIAIAPEILRNLNLENAVVTMDAAHAQLETLKVIHTGKGAYIVGVKGNQKRLHQGLKDLFEDKQNQANMFKTFDVAHGRQEQRTLWALSDLEQLNLADCRIEKWQEVGLKSVFMVEKIIKRGGKESQEKRYYIGSVEPQAEQALGFIRGHWSIENHQHYVLDVTFHEDANRTRVGFAGENLGLVRRMVMNVLSVQQSQQVKAGRKKISMRRMRTRSGWDDVYLLEMLGLKQIGWSGEGGQSASS